MLTLTPDNFKKLRKLPPDDPENRIPVESRLKINQARIEGLRIRDEARARIAARHKGQFIVWDDEWTAEDYTEWSKCKIDWAFCVLQVMELEFARAGITRRRELREIMRDELDQWDICLDFSDFERQAVLSKLLAFKIPTAELPQPGTKKPIPEPTHGARIEKLKRSIANGGQFKTKKAFYESLRIHRPDYYRWERGEKLRAPGHARIIESKIDQLPD